MTHIHLSAVIVVALMIALPTGCIYNNAERQAKDIKARVSRRKMAVFKFNQASELCAE